jgi:hypothetical protein
MKKLFILFFIIQTNLSTSSFAAGGTGEITLSSGTVGWFIKYIQLRGMNKPSVFIVTTDGRASFYWQCPYGECAPGNHNANIKVCETKYKTKCDVFATQRTVRWTNGINPGKGKASRFLSKWSDEEIRAKLKDLGFIENSKSLITQKSAEESTTDQLLDIIEQYKKGLLTDEEFKSAKKKILK